MTHHFGLTIPFLLAGALFAAGDVTPGMQRFAASAYKQLAPGESNLILSPFSISTALSMLLSGARGPTAAAIAKALDQHPGPGYDAAVAALAAELTKQANSGSNQLAIANGLWVQNGFPLEAVFQRTLSDVYQAPLTPVDFRAHTEEARQTINAWTAHHTNDKIQDLFAPGSINFSTSLVLTSAIYFYGAWQSPFKAADTHSEPFHLAGGTTADVPFMHQRSNFLYAETASAQILEMKYQGTPLAFDIVLPKAGNNLSSLEHSLTGESLHAWFAGMRQYKVDTAVPKFRSEAGFSLKEMLSHLGMGEAFARNADFSGIDGRHDLSVGDVVHKAFIDVSEEGTEAAAATGITVRPLAMRQMEQVVFRADHPFMFFIRDTGSGLILFEGRFVKP